MPASTSRVMLCTDWVSCSPPTNTCTARAATLRRTASSTSTAIRSSDSSLSTLGPPLARRTTGLAVVGGIIVRSAPRVHMSASACGSSGTMSRSIRSSPVVGPWK
jgi:hypothetical protein